MGCDRRDAGRHRHPAFSLKQAGIEIHGTRKAMLGKSPVSGNDISINSQVNAQGMDPTVSYGGTVDGATLKGTVELGGPGEGTVTGGKAG